MRGWVISVLTISAYVSPIIKAYSTSLRELRAKLMPLFGKQEDAFSIRTSAELQLREEAKVVELEVFVPPLYLSLTVASLAV